LCRVACDTGEGVGEPYAGVDLVQLGDGDERVLIVARSPPRSLPANSQAFRPRATPRSAHSAAFALRLALMFLTRKTCASAEPVLRLGPYCGRVFSGTSLQ
jgi:hypothetical protein